MLEINKIYQADALKLMKEIPENYVDAIITDPPYGLEFMGKEWDKFKDVGYSGLKQKPLQQFCFKWAKECLRVLKPGAYLLSFGGTRTYHRLVCGIEDAGFEIRDTIMWLYGSGFPKSLNIGKQIDKMAEEDLKVIKAKQELGKWLKENRGNKPMIEIAKHFLSKTNGITGCVSNWELGKNLPTWEIWTKLKELLNLDDRFDYLIEGRPKNYIPAEREIIGEGKGAGTKGNTFPLDKEYDLTAPATPEAQQWEGWGTALKPACEPIVVARKPLSEKNVALNVLKHGTGGINIDACRIQSGKEITNRISKSGISNEQNNSVFTTETSGFKEPTHGYRHKGTPDSHK